MPAGYDPNHFPAVFAVEDRHFWFSARNLALKTIIEGLTSRLPDRYRVLEIGCGTGNTLRTLNEACPAAAVIVGIDLFEDGLAYARRRTKVPVVCARIENAPFAAPFDLVGMFDVLEHIDDDAAALRQVRALTARGGYALLTVPAHMTLWSRFDVEAHHCRRYEAPQLHQRLADAGFSVEYLTLFMATLYPVARVSRALSDLADRVRQRFRGLVLRQEAPMLRRRMKLPIGTSLLAVARAV
jgi:SAM-dependent methyltransferase